MFLYDWLNFRLLDLHRVCLLNVTEVPLSMKYSIPVGERGPDHLLFAVIQVGGWTFGKAVRLFISYSFGNANLYKKCEAPV